MLSTRPHRNNESGNAIHRPELFLAGPQDVHFQCRSTNGRRNCRSLNLIRPGKRDAVHFRSRPRPSPTTNNGFAKARLRWQFSQFPGQLHPPPPQVTLNGQSHRAPSSPPVWHDSEDGAVRRRQRERQHPTAFVPLAFAERACPRLCQVARRCATAARATRIASNRPRSQGKARLLALRLSPPLYSPLVPLPGARAHLTYPCSTIGLAKRHPRRRSPEIRDLGH